MRRNIKKHKKELKRKAKKGNKLPSPNNKFWPAIYCLKEKIFIGVSDETTKMRRGKVNIKVTDKEWVRSVGRFRDEKYKIDMSKFEDGDIVHCPHCGSRVDFRIWLSATRPKFL